MRGLVEGLDRRRDQSQEFQVKPGYIYFDFKCLKYKSLCLDVPGPRSMAVTVPPRAGRPALLRPSVTSASGKKKTTGMMA